MEEDPEETDTGHGEQSTENGDPCSECQSCEKLPFKQRETKTNGSE